MRRLIVLLVVALAFAAAANADLVGHWSFDEGTGATLGDSVGTNNGTINGATWQATGGKAGGALSFDGVNDYVQIGDFAYTGANNEATVSFWFKSNDTKGLSHGFMFAHDYYINDNTVAVSLRGDATDPSGKVTSWIASDGATARQIYNPTSSVAYDDNTWHMYTMTHSGTTGTIVYIDGVQIASALYTGGFDPDDDIYLGCAFSGTSRSLYFGNENNCDARLDELNIFNNALTVTEIQALIPEPATLALLGLGCILLKRKSRK
jgi:hypothetical protein